MRRPCLLAVCLLAAVAPGATAQEVGPTKGALVIVGSHLVRGDTRSNTIMMGDHVEGMGFLKHAAIDQPGQRRNRQFDFIPVIEAHPELLGIGIDESTAIVVAGDRFQVMGAGYVLWPGWGAGAALGVLWRVPGPASLETGVTFDFVSLPSAQSGRDTGQAIDAHVGIHVPVGSR